MKKVVDGPPGWVCEPCNRVWDRELKRCSVCGALRNPAEEAAMLVVHIRASILSMMEGWDRFVTRNPNNEISEQEFEEWLERDLRNIREWLDEYKEIRRSGKLEISM